MTCVPGALPEAHQRSTEVGAGTCEHSTLGSNALRLHKARPSPLGVWTMMHYVFKTLTCDTQTWSQGKEQRLLVQASQHSAKLTPFRDGKWISELSGKGAERKMSYKVCKYSAKATLGLVWFDLVLVFI